MSFHCSSLHGLGLSETHIDTSVPCAPQPSNEMLATLPVPTLCKDPSAE
jgi:hypothetical protein